jgi:hypothetical protein
LLGAGCGTPARTGVEYNPKANFHRYQTYSWRPGTPSASPLMDERIVNSVNHELQRKGLRPVANNGDLKVTYHVSLERRLDVVSWDYLDGPYWTDYWARRTEVREIPEGRLIVDLIDSKLNQIVWRGIATDELTSTESDIESHVGRVTEEMFEDYPPKR